jgi:hypothetical protein
VKPQSAPLALQVDVVGVEEGGEGGREGGEGGERGVGEEEEGGTVGGS